MAISFTSGARLNKVPLHPIMNDCSNEQIASSSKRGTSRYIWKRYEVIRWIFEMIEVFYESGDGL